MLFRKKEKEEPRVCVGCGCLVARERAKEVVQDASIYYNAGWFVFSRQTKSLFYCGRCAPPYNRTKMGDNATHQYFTHVLGHDEEVTEKGKPIKNK